MSAVESSSPADVIRGSTLPKHHVWLASPAARLALVLGFAALICLRLPNVVLQGRLWAEEGAVFYVRAATLPTVNALFAPFGGYLNLVANAAPMVARQLVPLELVPWVMSGIGLLFQCFPAILLVCSPDPWLRRPAVRIAALLLLATPPVTEEVWLQTTTSQFHLALCCALILALDVPRGALRWFGFGLLFLAPLCGPSGAALVPFFLLRAWIDRSRVRLVQGCILAAAAGLQLAMFYAPEPGRRYGLSAATMLGVIYVKQIAIPFLGRDLAGPIAEHVKQRLAEGLFPFRAALVSLGVIASVCLVLVRRQFTPAFWLAATAALLLCLSLYGSLSATGGLLTVGEAGRYSFVPQVLAGLTLAAVASGVATLRRWDTWLARGAVVWLIAVGVLDVGRNDLFMGNGPSWRDEVALWRKDHGHRIAIWPLGYTMSLPSD